MLFHPWHPRRLSPHSRSRPIQNKEVEEKNNTKEKRIFFPEFRLGVYNVHPKEHFSSLSRERGAQWRDPPAVALEGGDWSGLLESGAERSAFLAGIAALSSTDDRRPGSLREAGTSRQHRSVGILGQVATTHYVLSRFLFYSRCSGGIGAKSVGSVGFACNNNRTAELWDAHAPTSPSRRL